jgi:ubiquinone/menaquinone biosynthesis C-methylase UbiE
VADQSFLPALRFRALTRVYDPLVRLTTREQAFKQLLLEGAALAPGARVLDLGCGTGTLALLAKEREPGIAISGLDADPDMLGQAREKADAAGADASFDLGLSSQLPYEDATFDRVLSSLFFHHLTPADKRRTLAEVTRVLASGGSLHIADWGPPGDPLMRAAAMGIRALDGRERTHENLAGELPGLLAAAGLEQVARGERLRTAFGVIELLSARKP